MWSATTAAIRHVPRRTSGPPEHRRRRRRVWYLSLLPLLSDPSAHGADVADASTVVIPLLPGYGFSGPPPATGSTERQVAAIWHALMSSALGHQHYVAHRSDLGAGVAAWLARDQPEAVRGIRLATPGIAPAPAPRAAEEEEEEEEEYAAAVSAWTAEEGGHTSTRRSPQRSAPLAPTVPPASPPALPRTSSRGAAPAETAVPRLTVSCC
jgi:pimeloyl-ACP methyl ester carboxylesterase